MASVSFVGTGVDTEAHRLWWKEGEFTVRRYDTTALKYAHSNKVVEKWSIIGM